MFVLQTKNCIFLPLFESIFSKERFQFFKFLTNNIWSHFSDYYVSPLKLRCDSRFQHAFTACNCVFKVMTLVGSNQGNYFENATACSKRMLKTTVATQLKCLYQKKWHHSWLLRFWAFFWQSLFHLLWFELLALMRNISLLKKSIRSNQKWWSYKLCLYNTATTEP